MEKNNKYPYINVSIKDLKNSSYADDFRYLSKTLLSILSNKNKSNLSVLVKELLNTSLCNIKLDPLDAYEIYGSHYGFKKESIKKMEKGLIVLYTYLIISGCSIREKEIELKTLLPLLLTKYSILSGRVTLSYSNKIVYEFKNDIYNNKEIVNFLESIGEGVLVNTSKESKFDLIQIMINHLLCVIYSENNSPSKVKDLINTEYYGNRYIFINHKDRRIEVLKS